MSWVKFWCCGGGDRESEREEEHRLKGGAQTEKKERGKRRRRDRKWSLWRKEEERETPLEENVTRLMEEAESEPVDISTETEQLLSVNTETAPELLQSVEDRAGPPSSTPLAGEQGAPGTSELLEILQGDVAGGSVEDQHLEDQTCEQTEEETRPETLLEEPPTSSTSLESDSGAPVMEKVEDAGVETPKTLWSSIMDLTVESFDDEKMMTVVRVIAAAEAFRCLQEDLTVSELKNLELPPANNTIAGIEVACEAAYVLLQRLASSPDQHLITKVLRVMATVPQYAAVGLLLKKHLNSVRGNNSTALEPGTEIEPEVGVDAEAETLQTIFFPHLDVMYALLVDEMLTGLMVQLAADALIFLRKVNGEPPVSNNNKSKVAIITQALDAILEELVTGRNQHLIHDFLRLMSTAPHYREIVEVLAPLLDAARTYYCGCLARDQTKKVKEAGAPAEFTRDRFKRLPQPPRAHRGRMSRGCPGARPPPPPPPPPRPEIHHGPRHQWQRHQGPQTRPRVPRHQAREEATGQWRQRHHPRHESTDQWTPDPRGCRHRPKDECAPPRGERDGFGGRGRRGRRQRGKRPEWWQHDDRWQ